MPINTPHPSLKHFRDEKRPQFKPFVDLAEHIVEICPDGVHRDEALSDLWKATLAARRAYALS